MRILLAIMRRMIRSVATRGRLAAMSAVGLVGVVIGFAVDRSDPGPDFIPAELLSDFGLILYVPLVVLVVSSATLGTLIEEKTLVYLWLRPVGRSRIVLAAFLSGIVVSTPLILVPMVALAAIVGDSGDIWGIGVASLVAVVGYDALFTLLGLLTRRALAWGLAYILVWEGFVAGLSRTAGWLALRTYAESTLSRVADVPQLLDDRVSASTIGIVTAAVAIVSFGLTTLRMRVMDVD